MKTSQLIQSILDGMEDITDISEVSQEEIAKATSIVAGMFMQATSIEEIETDDFIIKLVSK